MAGEKETVGWLVKWADEWSRDGNDYLGRFGWVTRKEATVFKTKAEAQARVDAANHGCRKVVRLVRKAKPPAPQPIGYVVRHVGNSGHPSFISNSGTWCTAKLFSKEEAIAKISQCLWCESEEFSLHPVYLPPTKSVV